MLSFFCFVFEGELLGMEYLYSQTGKTLTLVLQNPEEEDRLVEDVDDEDAQDEGFEEENMEDITVPVLFEDDPLPHLENRPSSSMTSPQASPPQAPVSPTHLLNCRLRRVLKDDILPPPFLSCLTPFRLHWGVTVCPTRIR